MSISEKLFYSILSMDSYNRDPESRLKLTDDEIGTATIISREALGIGRPEYERWDLHSFYAVAYEWNGQAIISYRGTDNRDLFDSESDIWNGWEMGAGFSDTSQGGLAIEFYETVLRQVNDDPALTAYDDSPIKPLLVGHSLGGGLAGFVSALSGAPAMIFDHMPFGAAAVGAAGSEMQRRVAGDAADSIFWPYNFEFVPVTPERMRSVGMHVPDFDAVRAMHVRGEALEGVRDGSTALKYGALGTALGGLLAPLAAYFGYTISTGQSEAEQKIENTELETFGWDGDETARHSQALLVTLLYAKENHGDDWHAVADKVLNALFDKYVASSTVHEPTIPILVPRTTDIAGDVLTAIAYSALDEGALPFGNTAIRAIFDDADQLGRLVSADDASEPLKNLAQVIANFIVGYGGLLAVKADTDAAHCAGILSVDGDTAYLSVVGPDWDFAGLPDDRHDSDGRALSWAARELPGPIGSLSRVMFSTTAGDSTHVILPEKTKGTVLFIGSQGRESITSKCDDVLIFGKAGDDEIFVNGSKNIVHGEDGDDLVHLLSGNNTKVIGNGGFDTVDFSKATNERGCSFKEIMPSIRGGFSCFVSDHQLKEIEGLVGTPQADTFHIWDFAAPAAVETYHLDGSGGEDRLDLTRIGSRLMVNLDKGVATRTTGPASIVFKLSRIEHISAGDGDDTLIGDGRSNHLEGNIGSDTLDGGAGNDTLVGGPGLDRFVLSKGRDVIEDFDFDEGDRLVGSGIFLDTTYEGHEAVLVIGDGGRTIIADHGHFGDPPSAAYFNELAAQGMIWA